LPVAANMTASRREKAGETLCREYVMKKIALLASAAAVALTGSPASANERYRERPPVVVSPDLSAPWVIQLGRKPGPVVAPRSAAREDAAPPRRLPAEAAPALERQRSVDRMRTAAIAAPGGKRSIQYQIDEVYLPQDVAYTGGEKPGTVIIDTRQNFLFLVQADGKARRYGVGTGKPGFEWAGTHKVTRKAEWPDWRPPSEMIAREAAKGHILPVHMPGGPDNPLGARALYLGSTLYRIHGTNQPWTIGGAVSSGCIRMRNEDVVDLYERVPVGATVKVI
jgi:lipoprotein-anchoring transpeptidase ErfK/SrfK